MGDVHRSKCKMQSPGGSHEQLIVLLIVHANVNLSDETPQVFLWLQNGVSTGYRMPQPLGNFVNSCYLGVSWNRMKVSSCWAYPYCYCYYCSYLFSCASNGVVCWLVQHTRDHACSLVLSIFPVLWGVNVHTMVCNEYCWNGIVTGILFVSRYAITHRLVSKQRRQPLV